MGTRFELVLIGEDAGALHAAARAALDEILLWHNRLSPFEPASPIARLNDLAGLDGVTLDHDTYALLGLALSIARSSGGSFDPTVGPLMRAWGHRGHPADTSTLDDIPAGHQHLLLDDTRASAHLTRLGMALDLGAIGKGWALDRAADLLRELGVTAALLHGGTSSVLAIGAPPGEPAWRVLLAETDATVHLKDAALGVSAPRNGHILDPRTRRPAAAAQLAACVHPSAALADAWSTAALVEAAHPSGAPRELASLLILSDGSVAGPTSDRGGAFHSAPSTSGAAP